MTWILRDDGYEVFFNRDEQRAREPALPPSIGEREGSRFVAPRDGNFGGSWLAVNEHGLTVALQNYYGAGTGPAPSPPVSRGLLVIGMMDCRGADEVMSRLAGTGMGGYRPFHLVVFDLSKPPVGATWDGVELTPSLSSPPRLPVSTSSYDTESVLRNRRELFGRMQGERGEPAAEWLIEYHRSHIPSRSACSVCMHRDDAKTVSFSHVLVDAGGAEFRYYPTSPCRMGEAIVARLPAGPGSSLDEAS